MHRLHLVRDHHLRLLDRRAALLVSAALLAVPCIVEAQDTPVSGSALRLQDRRDLRDGVARLRRKLSFDSGDAAIVSPAGGSASDPSIHGASLVLRSAAMGEESARVALPATGWTRSGDGWRYAAKSRSAGGKTATKVDLSAGRVSVRLRDGRGDLLGYSLDEPSQGDLDVVLELAGGASRYCAGFEPLDDEGSVDPGCNLSGSWRGGPSSAPVACPDTSGAPQPRDTCDAWTLLDLLIEGQMNATGIPGLGAAIVRDGEPLWSKGYGRRHISPDRPVLAETPFLLSSISKTITATAVLQLVEDGDFTLDQDIDTILAEPVDNPRVPGNETITVRHLMTHTSGLVDDEAVWGGYPGEPDSLYVLGDSPIALGDFLDGYFRPGGEWYDASRNFAADAPGTYYDYSNLATALLGYLVESATGTPLDDHSDARIFAPLAMGDTGWHLSDFAVNDVAMPYESFGTQFVAWGQYGYPDYPNGQARASAADLARFLAAWASGGTLDGQTILEPATVAEALDVQLPAVDPLQGLIWYRESIGGREVLGHNGGDYGSTTDMFFDPATGHGVVVLTNTEDTSARIKAMERIEEAMFAIAEAQ